MVHYRIGALGRSPALSCYRGPSGCWALHISNDTARRSGEGRLYWCWSVYETPVNRVKQQLWFETYPGVPESAAHCPIPWFAIGGVVMCSVNDMKIAAGQSARVVRR